MNILEFGALMSDNNPSSEDEIVFRLGEQTLTVSNVEFEDETLVVTLEES